MKKTPRLPAAFLALVMGILGAPALSGQSRPARDVVLVIDTSASMMGFYNEVGRYLSGSFLAENLALNDTLHIISFGGAPRFEIARRIAGPGDLQTAGGRIWLLYPVDGASDPQGAIAYTERYVKSIPGGRPRHVFVVSDDDLSGPVKAAADRRQSGAWTFIRAQARMGTGGRAAGSPAAEAGPRAAVSGPGGTGNEAPGSGAARPDGGGSGASTGPGASPTSPGTPGAEDSGGNSPGSGEAGGSPGNGGSPSGDESNSGGRAGNESNGAGGGDSGGTDRAGGQSNGAGRTDTASGNGGNAGSGGGFPDIPLPLLIGLGLAILLAILAAIILKARNLHNSPRKAVASAASAGSAGPGYRPDDSAARNAELLNSFASSQAAASLQGPPRRHHYRDEPGQVLANPALLNLFVEEQNTAIGRRNVHALKKGNVYTVGGGASDFLIFLVPVPPRLGQLSYDGANCTFTPLKPAYFPDIGSSPVQQCIGKTIRILSDKNYEIFFHFERYRDPLVALNQLLHSIQIPAAPIAGGSRR